MSCARALAAALAGLALGCDEIPVFTGSGGADPVGSVGVGGGLVYSSCGDRVDTFDAAPLPEVWIAEPADSAAIEAGQVALVGGGSTLTLLASPSSCAFSLAVTPPSDGALAFEVDDGAGSRVSVDVSLTAVSAVRYDAAGPSEESLPAATVDVDAVGLLFSADTISCLVHGPTGGWELVATFPRPAWVDASSPRVRRVGESSVPGLVDDYGVVAVPFATAP